MNKLFAVDKGKPSETIKTVMTAYWFNLDDPNQWQAYADLKLERASQGIPLLDMITGGKYPTGNGSREVTIETTCIFSNQWNTTEERLFDWFEGIYPNKRIKAGHYLQITDEMRSIRLNTFKCGYCGHEYYGKHNAGRFCSECLDSPYLKVEDLHLLRVMPLDRDHERAKLTQAEYDALKGAYISRQTKGKTSRATAAHRKEKKSIIQEAKESIKKARTKRDGLMWLYRHGINTENVIYYDHRDQFSFGWRTPLSQDTANELRTLLEAFPYSYEIKTQ